MALRLVDKNFPLNNASNTTPLTNITPVNITTPATIATIVEQEVQKDVYERLKTLPDRPTELPFSPTDDNISDLEIWLKDAFKGACFKY